jgi:NADH-quinone oxidoreductase subunit M
MLSHPLTTGALFLVIGMLYERRHTREISEYRGVWKTAPIMTAMFLIALFAGIGLPGFSGFIGEFLALTGTFVVERPFAIVATTGVVLAAVYSLWAFQRAFTGKPSGENATMRDVTAREVMVVAPLLALSLFLGIYPKPALDRIEPSVRRAVADLESKTDYREPDAPEILQQIRSGASEPETGEPGEGGSGAGRSGTGESEEGHG